MDAEASWVFAVVVVVVRDGRVLALRRSPLKDAGAGLWEVVSGRVESDEHPLEAAERETREESGLRVEIAPRPVDAYTARRAGRPMAVVAYRARWLSGEVRRSEEHDAHAWLTLEELRARTPLQRLVDAVERALALP